MNCNNCGCGLNISPKEIGKDDKGIPVYHRIGYCAYCDTSIDLDMIDVAQNNNAAPIENPNKRNERTGQSILGIIGFILSFISIIPHFVFIPLIFCFLSLKQKNKKNTFGKGGFVLCAMLYVSGISILSSHNENEANKKIAVPTETKEVFVENPVDNKEDTTIIEQEEAEVLVENKTEYTEEEYKNLCQELYYDDFFKNTQDVGTMVKTNVFIAEKYKGTPTSTAGIIVREITDKYNLSMYWLGCCVLHEETKNDSVPSYFGEQIYMMFVEDGDFDIDDFKGGEKCVLYGEVIQNEHGHFILPKYIEEDK